MSTFASEATSSELEPPMPSVLDIEEALYSRLGEISGCDNKSGSYESLTELWEYIYKPVGSKGKKAKKAKSSEVDSPSNGGWYQKAASYWESEANCPLNDGK